MTSVANNDAPDFEILARAAIKPAASSSSHQPVSGDAATTSSAAPTIASAPPEPSLSGHVPSVRLSSDDPANDWPTTDGQKTGAQRILQTATQPDIDGVFAPRSASFMEPPREMSSPTRV
jgi:hypothetical protein